MKIVKIIIEPLVNIVLNVARPTIWQGDVATHHQAIRETERDCWHWATCNQSGFAPESVIITKNYYLRNIIVVVVVSMFVFVGENVSLGPGHTTKLYVHL